jgi:hypothetical protein
MHKNKILYHIKKKMLKIKKFQDKFIYLDKHLNKCRTNYQRA